MKASTFISIAVLCASSVLASESLTCKTYSSHALKWKASDDSGGHGYLSFSNRKDHDGAPIATTRESDGSPAKPIVFTWATCSAPKGKPGYMGYGSGSKSNGVQYGHVQLKSDAKKCLAAAQLKPKSGTYFRLEDCTNEDTSEQLSWFFEEAGNGITISFLGHRNGTTDENYELKVGDGKGRPLQLDYVGAKKPHSSVFLNWLPTD
ncbi:hypothetical protein MSPP1_004033 [Malassezia sp. CBS 17886]|nr:hypothetical protein MSPP1_004033 [Malassezia sp. CBS 17886]